MLRRLCSVLLFLILISSLLSCNLDEDNPPGPSSNTVVIRDNSFNPATISVAVGRTVVWRHEGNNPHTVTSGTPTSNPGVLFDSGTLNRGGGFTFVFSQPGTYPYFCRIHGVAMTGSVVVR